MGLPEIGGVLGGRPPGQHSIIHSATVGHGTDIRGNLAPTRTARTPRSIGTVASTTPEKPPATAEKPPHRRESGPGIIIARPFGIPVYISPYWFLIAGVFIIIYANDLASTLHGSTRFIVAAAFVVLLYVSVLIHELSHSLVARSYGLPVRRILLYPLGGFSEIEREPPTPGREFLVSAAGPALSLALAAGGYGLMHVVAPDTVAGHAGQPAAAGPT